MRYEFADCVLDTESYQLQRFGAAVPVEPQVFELLSLLVENAGKLVSKDKIIERVWDGRIVSEATISARINAARTAVGDNGKSQAVIRTVQRRGLELVAPVETDCNVTSPAGAAKRMQTIHFVRSDDGTSIAYARSGDGSPVVRAGHFLTHLEKDWSSPVWGPYLKELSSRYSLIRYDQRGTGLSEAELKGTRIEDYVADLKAVVDAAGLETFPLVASSQGVPISIVFAAAYPERVSRLVLYGGFAQGRARRDHQYANDEANALMALIRSGWGKPDSPFMVAFTSVFCPGASKEEMDNMVEIQLASTSAENAATIRAAFDQFDVSACLPQVRVPTLIIHANADAVHPVTQGRRLASEIPGAEFLQVESNNHVYLPSDPAWRQIVDAQLEFLSREPGR
ncbi:DNA-binding winged helix-turn-helix (wHTH) protein/predicted alpha/beta hydrolase family esterase [Labrenzia sp. EL_126]|nr:DNA-binding winged helix-turn-helix (wHTH) protein/predicted alpha/beta hydrolase family esterase [Labrenzia sp. EL_126]